MTQPLDSAYDTSYGSFKLRRLAGALGAEVLDFRLSSQLPAIAIGDIEQALLRHKALFFRGQSHLDDREQQAFGARFGKPVAHPTVPAPAGTSIFELDASTGGGRADSWHTDVTFVANFPKISVLRGVTIPAVGGDTVWANSVAAYEALPEPLKRLAESLWAAHSNDYDYGASRLHVEEHRLRHHNEVFLSAHYEAEHPLVHVHPVSGERALLLGHFIRHFVDIPKADSARLFDLFQQRAIRIENTVRWNWRQDDVAIWDNRTTQHIAINDYGDQPRVVRRVTIEGDPAVSVDGRRSRTRRAPESPDQHSHERQVLAAA